MQFHIILFVLCNNVLSENNTTILSDEELEVRKDEGCYRIHAGD